MGGKSGGTRKHLLFCFTFMMFGSGCALFGAPSAPEPKPFAAAGDYRAAATPPPAPSPPAPSPTCAAGGTRLKTPRRTRTCSSLNNCWAKGIIESSLRESKGADVGQRQRPADAAVFAWDFAPSQQSEKGQQKGHRVFQPRDQELSRKSVGRNRQKFGSVYLIAWRS